MPSAWAVAAMARSAGSEGKSAGKIGGQSCNFRSKWHDHDFAVRESMVSRTVPRRSIRSAAISRASSSRVTAEMAKPPCSSARRIADCAARLIAFGSPDWSRPGREYPTGSFQHVPVFQREYWLDEVIRVAVDLQDAFQPADDAAFPLVLPFPAGKTLIDGSPRFVTSKRPAGFVDLIHDRRDTWP